MKSLSAACVAVVITSYGTHVLYLKGLANLNPYVWHFSFMFVLLIVSICIIPLTLIAIHNNKNK